MGPWPTDPAPDLAHPQHSGPPARTPEMARDEAPPFQRGETFYNGGTIDPNDLGGVNLEGKEFEFEDDQRGTGHRIRVRVVRNVSAGPILPKRLVTFQAANFGRRVDGYA